MNPLLPTLLITPLAPLLPTLLITPLLPLLPTPLLPSGLPGTIFFVAIAPPSAATDGFAGLNRVWQLCQQADSRPGACSQAAAITGHFSSAARAPQRTA
jgi:hypothetical protein